MNAKRSGRDARHAWFAQHQGAFQTSLHNYQAQTEDPTQLVITACAAFSSSRAEAVILPALRRLRSRAQRDTGLGCEMPYKQIKSMEDTGSSVRVVFPAQTRISRCLLARFSLLAASPLALALWTFAPRDSVGEKKRGKSWVITGGWISSRRAGESMSIVLCLIAGARSTSLDAG
jgi:hypothetical protein